MPQQPERPTPSRRTAQTFASTTVHLGAPVRRSFVTRADEGHPTGLEAVMRAARGGAGGGRGGRTRLALLLSLWWVNSMPPYTSQRPASWWAEMIGIEDPVRGPRTVTANLQELARRGFIAIAPGEPGMANVVTLLDDLARPGQPYLRPDGKSGSYFRVPEKLWTTGAIARLSGPGLAMYLVVLSNYHRPAGREHSPGEGIRTPAAPPVWFSPKRFRERHGLSEDTRLAGVRNLRDAGMVDVETEYVDVQNRPDSGHRRFQRQMLTLHPLFVPPLPGRAPARDHGSPNASSTTKLAELLWE